MGGCHVKLSGCEKGWPSCPLSAFWSLCLSAHPGLSAPFVPFHVYLHSLSLSIPCPPSCHALSLRRLLIILFPTLYTTCGYLFSLSLYGTPLVFLFIVPFSSCSIITLFPTSVSFWCSLPSLTTFVALSFPICNTNREINMLVVDTLDSQDGVKIPAVSSHFLTLSLPFVSIHFLSLVLETCFAEQQ